MSGTLFIKDNVKLVVASGAVLLGSTNLADYPITRCEFPSRTDTYTARALIWGEGLRNVGISGPGTIDGQGAVFRDFEATPEEMAAHTEAYTAEGRHVPTENYFNRPYIIRMISCRDVLIENLTLLNSPMWMQHYLDCDFVTLRGVKVINHGAANNDMVDIDCCRDVVISDCFGDSDDDALTLKSTGARPTERVTITNCVLASHCNAIKAGTESAGGFKDIAISNCVITRSAYEHLAGRAEGLGGIALEIVDGGTLDGVTISNITVQDTTAPIFMRLGNRARPAKVSDPKPGVGTFRNVSISNIVARGASNTGCAIAGIPGHPIENVSLSNVQMIFMGGGTAEQVQAVVPENEDKYPESTMFGTLPAYGLYVRHVSGLSLNDIQLSTATPDLRPAVVCDDVHGLRIEALRAAVMPDAIAAVLLNNTSNVCITGSQAAEGSTFLRLNGACERVSLLGNDFSRARVPFSSETEPAPVLASGN
ncbi:MAG: glycoside hydrolase, partial [Candidatus Hydrogenedentes bacterium]|nr:glycoside hydrolase [Candidatus Hydrogenedentota bacterium]